MKRRDVDKLLFGVLYWIKHCTTHCCAPLSAGYGYLEGVESHGYLRGAQDMAEHN